MTIRIARHVASTLTIVAVFWGMVGCDDGGVKTTVPADTPPPKATADGKPMPPPTAGQTKVAVPAK
jgi:hypothetical protein